MIDSIDGIELWLNENNVENYTINDDMTVDVDGDVDLSAKGLSDIPVQFGVVNGDFYINDNQLVSLKGCPTKVKEDFKCYCNNLISLNNAPKEVGGSYYCSENNLSNLEGAPEIIKLHFDCSENQLTSLKGCPKEVGFIFNCADNKLKSTNGLPKKTKTFIDIQKNPIDDYSACLELDDDIDVYSDVGDLEEIKAKFG